MNIYENIYKIDSFKVRILTSKLTSSTIPKYIGMKTKTYAIDEDFDTPTISINETTGVYGIENEVPTKDKVENKFTHTIDNYITQMNFTIENIVIDKSGVPYEFLTFIVTSKHLQYDYFKGVTLATIPLIIEYLSKVNIYIDIQTLLQCQVTDVDVCIDTHIPNWTDFKSRIISQIKEYKQRDKGVKEYDKDNNKGIEFGRRETANITYPYLKIYNKHLDATNLEKHANFFNAYELKTPVNTHRIEYTLKNKKHLEKYGIGNKLIDILNVSQDKWTQTTKSITSYHFDKVKTNIDTSLYTDTISVVLSAFLQMKKDEYSVKDIEDVLRSGLKKNTSLRLIEKLTNINLSLINKNVTYKTNDEINKVLDMIF